MAYCSDHKGAVHTWYPSTDSRNGGVFTSRVLYSTANDPHWRPHVIPQKIIGMEWILDKGDECAENLSNALNNKINKTINNPTVSFGNFFLLSLKHSMLRCCEILRQEGR